MEDLEKRFEELSLEGASLVEVMSPDAKQRKPPKGLRGKARENWYRAFSMIREAQKHFLSEIGIKTTRLVEGRLVVEVKTLPIEVIVKILDYARNRSGRASARLSPGKTTPGFYK